MFNKRKMLSSDFLTHSLDTQLDWVHGIYGRMVAWNEYDRHSEYVEIIKYLSERYTPKELLGAAKNKHKRLSWDFDDQGEKKLRHLYQTELECLESIARYGTFPHVRYQDPRFKEFEKLAFRDEVPVCMKDLIRCMTELSQVDLPQECRDYLENFVFTGKDYANYICRYPKWDMVFQKLAKIPQAFEHLDNSLKEDFGSGEESGEEGEESGEESDESGEESDEFFHKEVI